LASLAAKQLAFLGAALEKILTFSLADERIAPGRCLAVHLDTGGIAVAFGSRFLSRIGIKGTRYYPLEAGKYPGPESFASTVRLALNDLGAPQADVTLVVPKAWTIVKTVDFPLIVKENLTAVIGYELDRLTPLSPEKAYYDFQVLREDADRLQLLLAVLKAETLDPYLNALRQEGIKIKRVSVSLAAFGVLSSTVQKGKAVVFMDFQPGRYEGGLMERGRLTVSFAGDLSSPAAPEETGAIATTINSLIKTWEKEGKSPALVVNAALEVRPLLARVLPGPIRFLEAKDLRLPALSPAKIIPYTALGGAIESLRPGRRGLNLLAKGIHDAERTPVALSILLLLAMAGLGLFTMAASLQRETKKVEAIENQIAARSNEVKEIEALQKNIAALEQEIATIHRFKTSKPMVLDLLKELTKVLPPNTWLTRALITDTTVAIEGYSLAATDILPKLEASRSFRKVEFSSPTFRDTRMGADRFAVKMEREGLTEGGSDNEEKQ